MMETKRISIYGRPAVSTGRGFRRRIVAAALLMLACAGSIPGAWGGNRAWETNAGRETGIRWEASPARVADVTDARMQVAMIKEARMQDARMQEATIPDITVSDAKVQKTCIPVARMQVAMVQKVRIPVVRVSDATVPLITVPATTVAAYAALAAQASLPSAQTTKGDPGYAKAGRDYTVETIPNLRLQDGRQHVSNPDGIISPADVAQINRILGALEDSLGIEVAVVAVNSIGDADPRSFATDLFNRWGLGKKGKDNGLLIQLVTAPPQRSVVFETGYGLEGVLPDAISYRLQQQAMIPDLKAGRYSAAMTGGVAAVANYLLSHYDPENPAAAKGGKGAASGGFLENFGMGFLLLFVFVFILVAFTFRRRGAQVCPRCGKKALVYTGQRVVSNATATKPAVVEDVYQCKNCGYTDTRNRHSSNGRNSSLFPFLLGGLGGFLGGPRGGGGFGGFGGGSWGGGASGGGGSISRF